MSSIDVIVPCYRYGCFLRQCVQSVLGQGIADLRVLIIDDESPDETPEVGAALAREDSRVAYRRHAANRGHICTYNEGIDWTKSDYTLLLSADDYLLPGALKRAMDFMDAHSDVGLCFGEALELRESGCTQRINVSVVKSDNSSIVMAGADFVRLISQGRSRNFVPTPTAVVKTSLLKRLGGYRADLPHSGDLEMWFRLAAHGSVGILKADQAVYRRHAQNMSLAYNQDNCLRDLQQRKAAFDAFLETCGEDLPEAKRLYVSLLIGLAQDAVSHASLAFNAKNIELSRRLRDFAVGVYPGITNSIAWNMLLCKTLLGFKVSSAIQPSVARIRAGTAKLRTTFMG